MKAFTALLILLATIQFLTIIPILLGGLIHRLVKHSDEDIFLNWLAGSAAILIAIALIFFYVLIYSALS